MSSPDPRVTQLLAQAASGDRKALNELLPLIDTQLRSIAAAAMRRERKDHTLQPTALVNEADLRLLDGQSSGWKDRNHAVGQVEDAARVAVAPDERMRRGVDEGT